MAHTLFWRKLSSRYSELVAVVIVSSFLCSCQPQDRVIKISGTTFGTTYNITVVGGTVAKAELSMGIESLLSIVDEATSSYREDSEISLFNAAGINTEMKISETLWQVLRISKEVWDQSHGSFDPTVGALVELWGFDDRDGVSIFPTDEEIEFAASKTGFDSLTMKADSNFYLLKKSTSLILDVSAVAKGYAVDLIADYLATLSLNNYLVEIGGEIKVKGHNPKGQEWRVAIESASKFGSYDRLILLNQGAVATSGSYRNFFEKEGIHYSHIINPRSGYPLIHNLKSVTVIMDECAYADAWATAFSVMSEEEAISTAIKLEIPLYIAGEDPTEKEPRMSPAFRRYNTELMGRQGGHSLSR